MSTLTNFRTELASVLGLDNATTGDQPLMDVYLNEGVLDCLVKTHCKVSPLTMTLTSGEKNYTLPSQILVIIDLFTSSQGSDYHFERMTPQEILAMRRNASGSSPARYYATSGANLLMVYPTPTAADTLTGIYVPRPATLSAGADTPSEIPAEWHKLVSFYALWRMADADDDASSEMGERYRALYEVGVREARTAVLKHGGTRLAPARIRDRRRVPVNPSTSPAHY